MINNTYALNRRMSEDQKTGDDEIGFEEQRPWGSFRILDSGNGFKVKVLVVEPGKRLSYQKHHRRAERWIVVEGNATVVIDGVESKHGVGDMIIIGKGQKHRLSNEGAFTLRIIEVQVGDYFGEDDIIRLEDDFGRS